MSEISLAIRSLLKSKVFTAVAVLTLAIGIGATTAVFSLFDAVALRSLPFAAPDRLVDIEEWSATELCPGCGVGMSAPMVAEIENRTRTLQAIAVYGELGANLSGRGAPERVSAAAVSGNFFGVLGIQATSGRGIDPTDERHGAPRVAVISERLFHRRFGSDPLTIGQTIRLNGQPTTIVGIMPAAAVLPDFAQIWMPLDRSALGNDRSARELGVIGRLRDGVTRAKADAELKKIAEDMAQAFPETQKTWTARARSLREAVGDDERGQFQMILVAVFLLWAIVCANIAALLLSRGISRRRELAVRRALGASRRTIVWHLFAESLVIAIAGGVLGSVIAAWGIEGIEISLGTGVPTWLAPRLDGAVVGFCVLLSLISAAAFGLIPAVRASRPEVHEDLRTGVSAVGGGNRSALRGSLVVVQLSLSLALVAAAGVLSTTIASRSYRDDTRDADIVQARVEIPADVPDDARAATVTALAERFGALPEARAASASADGFIAGFGSQDQRIKVEGIPVVADGVSPRFYHAVTPNFFETQGSRVVEGRRFSAADGRAGNPVVIINRRLAARLWPTGSAVGRRVKLGADSLPWRTIVGVVSDVGDTLTARSAAYVPYAQSPFTRVTLFVAAKGDPSALINPMREAAREIVPDLPLLDHMSAAQAHAMTWRPIRAVALAISTIGAVAVLLAAVGLYGIVAYGAEQRTREIGVRIALGAGRGDVVRLVTRQGLVLVALGVGFGWAASALVTPVMRGLLFGASPFNVVVLAGSALLLVIVAAVASYLPARRAAATDPMVALRTD